MTNNLMNDVRRKSEFKLDVCRIVMLAEGYIMRTEIVTKIILLISK